MGRWGTEKREDYDYEDDAIDWAAFRPIRPVKKIRVRLKPSKAIPAAKKRVRLRSDLLSTIRPEQTEERSAATIKLAIRKAIENNPDTRDLQKKFPTISLVTLSVLKIEYRKQLKQSGRL